jgi:kumamolisin
MNPEQMVAIPGTEHPLPADAEPLGALPPGERIEVTLHVRPRQSLDALGARLNQPGTGERPVMSREEFAAQYGADPDAIARVEAFARTHGLTVLEVSAPRRSIRLAGTAADLGAAFGVDLQRYRLPDGQTFRAHAGPSHVPANLSDAVQSVFGLDTRPIARPR